MKIVSISLLLSILTLTAHSALAESSACPERDQASLDALEDQNPDAYEEYRKCRAANSKDEAEFLQWATPEEIAAATGMDQIEGMTSQTSAGEATVDIQVDLSGRSMVMNSPSGTITGGALGTAWRKHYRVPKGCFTQGIWTDRNHHSKEFDAPMPNAVFFYRGSALHYGSLKVPSHGCVHLGWSTSLAVINTVLKYGTANTRICVE